ncbi:Histone deacetylase-like amidohydrolase [Halomicronema hongdechloris C2206]|uniref:Histone deacetylase-like amidohydrolase n=1 Tax=Halomicronema hongdechloris C2206 TaxID=1641165 RepID=A0A1Z3HGY9_9CYAN|nr:histone deacetylase [Halomicronema hongdechloris]ASC69592.1 Histone deacetylase-like amidohydrolase [Halomicronema hongdechloris C2206]
MVSEFAVIYSPQFLEHDTGAFHPENPGRLTAIVAALQGVPWADAIDWRSPTATSQRQVLPYILKLHNPEYVEALRRLAQEGGGYVDGDTPVSPHSYDVALLAVSAWLDGVDYVLTTGHSAFVLVRPPGHHAIRNRGMGFCLFSNTAVAAHYALAQAGIGRVAILDWDVHHGNGTQALVEDHPRICYCSIHQSPAYPGTGRAEERGEYNNVLNVPMPAGSIGADYQAQFEGQLIPFLKAFEPDLLIISAGYDANKADPLAGIALQPQDFGRFTKACSAVCDRILFGLEGGYDHEALSQSVLATIAARLGLD